MKAFLKAFETALHIAKTSVQFGYGRWRVEQLPRPRITIFGGHKLSLGHPFSIQAHELAHKLVQNNIGIITGGGSGIMEAANCGALHNSKPKQRMTIGISVSGLHEEGLNMCVESMLVVRYFFIRKWLLINYSDGFAIFPGGFGTLDEFGEIITLIQTKKLPPLPIILIGTGYWSPLREWIEKAALPSGLINQEDVELITFTDNIQEAIQKLTTHCDTLRCTL